MQPCVPVLGGGVSRHIVVVDPASVDEGRRRHLQIVGELLPRLHLHHAGPRQAFAQVGGQREPDILGVARQAFGEDVAVFNGHVGALCQRRHGRVCRISQQRNPPFRPLEARVAIENAPLETILAGVRQELEQYLVPSGIGRQQFLASAGRGP